MQEVEKNLPTEFNIAYDIVTEKSHICGAIERRRRRYGNVSQRFMLCMPMRILNVRSKIMRSPDMIS